jgi:hypothetical protein
VIALRTFVVQGDTNPALCAMKAVRAMYGPLAPINEQSFRNVANAIVIAQRPANYEGFFVEGWDDLNRLCELGNFYIFVDTSGRFTARKHDETKQ